MLHLYHTSYNFDSAVSYYVLDVVLSIVNPADDFPKGRNTLCHFAWKVPRGNFASGFCRRTFYVAVEYSALIKIIRKSDEKGDRSPVKH